uniref:C2H2-type domain-containing protein n=1 Tax=Timema tahoe TaxID=61484 RepID=A0A7R9FMM0_9NEOP|nr:unnamed protein product [Timema tahoe]
MEGIVASWRAMRPVIVANCFRHTHLVLPVNEEAAVSVLPATASAEDLRRPTVSGRQFPTSHAMNKRGRDYEKYIAADDDITVWGNPNDADIIREQQELSDEEGEEEMEEEPEDIPTMKDVPEKEPTEGELTVTAADVCLYGLDIIMPLMTIDLLTFPSLCLQYFKMITFACEIYPDKVCKLPLNLLKSLLMSLELGLTSFGQDVIILCCDFIQVMGTHIFLYNIRDLPVHDLLRPFLKRQDGCPTDQRHDPRTAHNTSGSEQNPVAPKQPHQRRPDNLAGEDKMVMTRSQKCTNPSCIPGVDRHYVNCTSCQKPYDHICIGWEDEPRDNNEPAYRCTTCVESPVEICYCPGLTCTGENGREITCEDWRRYYHYQCLGWKDEPRDLSGLFFRCPPCQRPYPLPTLPDFHGRGHEDPTTFTQRCELQLRNARIDQLEWVPTIQQQLKDTAAQWWKLYGEYITTWEEFKQRLTHHFASTSTIASLHAELYGKEQTQTEPVEIFLRHKIRLYQRLAPTISSTEIIPVANPTPSREGKTEKQPSQKTTEPNIYEAVINSVNPSTSQPLPRVLCKTPHGPLLALLDTGATANFIQYQHLTPTNLKHLIPFPTPIHLAKVGSNLTIQGQITLPLTMQTLEVNVTFLVSDELREPLILRQPWFTEQKNIKNNSSVYWTNTETTLSDLYIKHAASTIKVDLKTTRTPAKETPKEKNGRESIKQITNNGTPTLIHSTPNPSRTAI